MRKDVCYHLSNSTRTQRDVSKAHRKINTTINQEFSWKLIINTDLSCIRNTFRMIIHLPYRKRNGPHCSTYQHTQCKLQPCSNFKENKQTISYKKQPSCITTILCHNHPVSQASWITTILYCNHPKTMFKVISPHHI